MPEPMVPEPTIPTRLMFIGLSSSFRRRKDADQATGAAAEHPKFRRVGSINMNNDATGTLALVGGAEWREGGGQLDAPPPRAPRPHRGAAPPPAAPPQNPPPAAPDAPPARYELGPPATGAHGPRST